MIMFDQIDQNHKYYDEIVSALFTANAVAIAYALKMFWYIMCIGFEV